MLFAKIGSSLIDGDRDVNKFILSAVLSCLPVFAFANDIDAAKNTILESMKDPDSTKFKGVRSVKNSIGQDFVCGEVNSKNSYGGYVGFKGFAYKAGRLVIDGDYKTPDDLEFYATSGCGGKNLEKVAIARKNAIGGCEISWGQISDVILFGATPEKAAFNAISKIKNKNPKFSQEQESAYIETSVNSLKQTLSNSEFVTGVKTNTNATKNAFMSTCVDTTSKALSGM